MQNINITAADLRAELARRQLPVYILAARVRLHPVRLGRLLNGRLTLTPQLATRIVAGINGETDLSSVPSGAGERATDGQFSA